MEAREFYDTLGQEYDLMVSWEERLRREEGFFRRVFGAAGVESVLDAACGTGAHAVAFARWGYRAAAADISPVMIEEARENARRAGLEVDFRVAPFGGMAREFKTRFDAVTCLGNSLPHLRTPEELIAAIADFAATLKPGGLLVIQNRNYDRVLRGPERSLHLNARPGPGGETLFLRMSELRGGEALDFTIITLKKRDGAWSHSMKSTPLRALTSRVLEQTLGEAGFAFVKMYGDYSLASFDAPGTADLIAIAGLASSDSFLRRFAFGP